MITTNCRGFIFDIKFFEYLFINNLLQTFASNFYTTYAQNILEEHFLILQSDWDSDRLNSIFEFFEFDLLSFPINSKIEVCYRNVDLHKLTKEMKLISKNLENYSGF